MHPREMGGAPVGQAHEHPDEQGPHAELAGAHPDGEERLDPGQLGVVEQRLDAREDRGAAQR